MRRSTINDIVHCVQTTSQNIETYYTTFFKYLHCREKYIYYNTFIKNKKKTQHFITWYI